MRILLIVLFVFTESVMAETIVFGPGVHTLSKPVVIKADNTYLEVQQGAVLRGVDPVVTIVGPVTNIGIYGTGTLEGGVKATGGVTNISLENFTITLAKDALSIHGQYGGCRNLSITGLTIHDVGEGIVFRNCQNFVVSNNTVSDMWAQDGIEPVNSQRGIISNNRITNPGTANSAIDVFVNYSTVPGELAEVSSVTVSDNILIRTTQGYLASGINIDGNATGVSLRGNDISGTFANGIRLLRGCRNISISNNTLRNLYTGISVEQADNAAINGNQFMNMSRWSVVTGVQSGSPILVVGNQFSGNANHIAGSSSITIDANTFSGYGWAIGNGTNPVMSVTNNKFIGPYSVSKLTASNLFMYNNTYGP